MQEFQQRVVDEATELRTRPAALDHFVKGSTFGTIDVAERIRLRNQRYHMHMYLGILDQRVLAFGAAKT